MDLGSPGARRGIRKTSASTTTAATPIMSMIVPDDVSPELSGRPEGQ